VRVNVAPPPTVTVTGPVPLPCGWLESVAVTVTEDVPVTVGVPEITHPAPSVSPAGNAPELIEHEYGPVPPVTGIVPV
jgi:hypothetical protein